MNYVIAAIFIIVGIVVIIQRKVNIEDNYDHIFAVLKGSPAIWAGLASIAIGIILALWGHKF